jgi:Fungal specific transcription factor domain
MQTSSGEVNSRPASRNNDHVLPYFQRDESNRPRRIECTKSSSPLTKQISLSSAFRDQFFNQFISSWIPDADLAVQKRKPKDGMVWLMLLPELSTRTRALEVSTLALCTARVGRLHDDPVLVNESMELYGQGLRELQKALWDPNMMYKDETLAACIALSMYEVLECPLKNSSGWVTHSQGCARLVQLRGPKAHISALGHQLFLSARFMLVSSPFCAFIEMRRWT